MSDLNLSPSFVDEVLLMGFSYSAIELAHQATNSRDSNALLEWILTHENEIHVNNTNQSNETHPISPIIQKVIELGFPKNSAELAQRKTKSNDVQTLIDWILEHDSSENVRFDLLPPTTTSSRLGIATNKQEENKKTDDTLLNELLKLGFERNDIENCFIELNINTTKTYNLKIKRIECIDWLIDNSQKKAQTKAKEIRRSRKQLRTPSPINLNQTTNSHSTTPHIITNNFLKQVHLSSRHETVDNDEQQPPLTREEALMADIQDNLKKHSWTIYNLDQLNLLQKYIKIIAKIIDEDHQNIQRYDDDDEDDNEKIQPSQTTTARQSKNDQTKNIFTLADLAIQDQNEYRPNGLKALATPPRKLHVPGASEEADWDPSLLKELDRTAVQLEYKRGENYRQLADRLIKECRISPDNQISKIRAIFVWITSHIRYDMEMFRRDNSQKNENKMDELCQLVLNTQSCVCVGYAVLFKRMCEHFNIQIDYVSGYTKLTKSCINDTTDGDNIAKLSGHAWTMVYLNGKTFFTDPTWSAARWSSSNEIKSKGVSAGWEPPAPQHLFSTYSTCSAPTAPTAPVQHLQLLSL